MTIGLTFLLAYLVGSIPFGLLITRALGLGDLRAIGSGNIGATNVLRTGNKGAAAATLVLDAAKGAVAVFAARALAGEGAAMVAALGAFLGHLFPVWLGFRGGKGVATGLGAFVPAAPLACLLALLAFAGVLALTRYVSLGSIAGALALPPALLALDAPAPLVRVSVLLALLIVAKHKDNIARLLQGSERRLGGGA
jgi:glycerol-3-phosphate acyltransferase PlsY